MQQISRRGLMAGAAAAPVFAAVPCVPGSAWSRALDTYAAARLRHEQFLAHVLDPEARMARSQGQGLTARISRLEDQGNDLCSVRHGALWALVHAPATDCAALRVKLRLAYEEYLRFEDDEGFIAAILTDFERLLE